MPDIVARRPEAYPAHVEEGLRYRDTDRQGHVNNAVYATFFESGRVHLLADPRRPFAPPGAQFVIVRLTIEFRRELLWPGTIRIGTGVTRIGGKSFALEQAIHRDGELVATAESVLAIMDEQTRRAVPIPDETRALLENLLLPPA